MTGLQCFVKKLIMYFNINKYFCLCLCVCVCVCVCVMLGLGLGLGLGFTPCTVHDYLHATTSTYICLHVLLLSTSCTTITYLLQVSIIPILSTIPSCVYSLCIVYYVLLSTSLCHTCMCTPCPTHMSI